MGSTHCLVLGTVDHLLALNCSDQLLLKQVKNSPYRARYPIEEVNCTEPSPSERVPCSVHHTGVEVNDSDTYLDYRATELITAVKIFHTKIKSPKIVAFEATFNAGLVANLKMSWI